MEVEMVLSEVREYAAGEVDARCPSKLERVRGDLHDTGRVTGVGHPPQRRLQVDRLRRRVLGRLLDATDDLPHGAEQPRLDARRREQVADEEGRRRLAVGPG